MKLELSRFRSVPACVLLSHTTVLTGNESRFVRKNDLKAHFHLYLNWIFCSRWPSCIKLIVPFFKKYQTYFKTFFPRVVSRSIAFGPGSEDQSAATPSAAVQNYKTQRPDGGR